MQSKQRFLLAAAFIAAAVGNATVAVVCMCAIIALQGSESEQALGIEALILALFKSILSGAIAILTMLLRVVNAYQFTIMMTEIFTSITNIAGILVFIAGMYMAVTVLRGKTIRPLFLKDKQKQVEEPKAEQDA